ncbi:MAG: quinone-dependent dihydroorotate dehydrogenase [Opitutales bacterium]|nr:quinone-dependent dihydroorotate dehydrogenase [Opitutales bacterium]
MDFIYEKLVRPVFFRQDPETVHHLAVKGLQCLGAIAPLRAAMEKFNLVRDEKPTEAFGVKFPNKIGLAAGFDKDALVWRAMPALGFGHVEIGTVTCHDQAGNPKPRIFRYPKDEAIVNFCGFPNDGAETIAERLSKSRAQKTKKVPLGINIGKSKITPIEDAAQDYIFSYNKLADFADYFTVNVSCPNLPELRKLQSKGDLERLMSALKDADAERAEKFGKAKVPFLVKIAPDLTFREIDDVIETVENLGLGGIVATNTTTSRPEKSAYETRGGLSGSPIFDKSREVVAYICKNTKKPVIAVGGISDTERAAKMFDAGACLVQIYSSFIFKGPFFAKELAKSLYWRSGAKWL